MQNYRFRLQPYKGMSTRHECPSCHRHKCFSRYIDTYGLYSFPDYVGRCNHENSCGYHYPPRQFFQDNPQAKTDLLSEQKSPKIPTAPFDNVKKVEPYFFDEHFMKETENDYHRNNFFLFMQKNFGTRNTKNLIQRYHVATSGLWEGATIFWQVDYQRRIRDGKIIYYDTETGHRSKEEKYHISWEHYENNINKNRIHPCFFGEHLLPSDTESPIAIVESEKTAIISSFYIPQYIWIATGGKDGMFSQCNFNILRNRKIMMVPDLGMLDNWKKKALTLRHHDIDATCYEFLERHASDKDKEAGLDIADFLLRKNPLQHLLLSMSKQSPAIEELIDKLDLEIVID